MTRASKSPLPSSAPHASVPSNFTKKGNNEEFRSGNKHRKETNEIPRMTKKGGPGNLEKKTSTSKLKDRGL